MPTVWVKEDPKYRRRFHRRPDCHQLTKPSPQGEVHGLQAIDLEQVHVRPCRTCYPDAPNLALRKRYCPICQSKYACEHNGGVLIHRRVTGWPQWVWPDTNQMPYYRSQAI